MESYENISQKLVGSLTRGGRLPVVPTGFTYVLCNEQ